MEGLPCLDFVGEELRRTHPRFIPPKVEGESIYPPAPDPPQAKGCPTGRVLTPPGSVLISQL